MEQSSRERERAAVAAWEAQGGQVRALERLEDERAARRVRLNPAS